MFSERLESEDIRETDDFTDCLSRKELAERRTEEILAFETQEAIDRRALKCFRTGSEVVSRQESEINAAFFEVNYYRAELAELCTNTTMNLFEKQYLVKYANAVMKELNCRKVYSKIVLTAAQNDINVKTPNAFEDWLYRIQNDSSVVVDLRAIRDNKEMNKRLHDRKKNEFDYNRAKAILKADKKAFKSGD
jgi:hypothetical protein